MMTVKTSISARGLREGIKKGYTKADFCEKYSCSESELLASIGQLYSRNNDKCQKKILKQIESNEKKARRHSEVKVLPIIEEDVIIEPEFDSESEQVMLQTEAESEAPVSIDRLIDDESACSDAVIALESEHKKLVQSHRTCIDKLRDIDKDIDNIRS